jgi:hypothetical protein
LIYGEAAGVRPTPTPDHSTFKEGGWLVKQLKFHLTPCPYLLYPLTIVSVLFIVSELFQLPTGKLRALSAMGQAFGFTAGFDCTIAPGRSGYIDTPGTTELFPARQFRTEQTAP